MLALLWCLMVPDASAAAQTPPVIPAEGLLHWWPDPAEGMDEVTGRKGVRRGLGPQASDPRARFGGLAGWMELGPGITNTTFTITCWIRRVLPDGGGANGGILVLDSGLQDWWGLQGYGCSNCCAVASWSAGAPAGQTPWVVLGDDWHFLAIRVASSGVEILLDDRWSVRGVVPIPAVGPATTLCVGNRALGNDPWDGDIRDLRIYGRALTDVAIRELSGQPRPEPRALPTGGPAIVPEHVAVHVAGPMAYRVAHWTTDHGLPTAHVQTLLQRGNGALWLGLEHGPFQFNGRRFELLDGVENELARTSPDVICMTEHPTGTVWLGLFRGLLRLKPGVPPKVFSQLSPASYVRAMAPSGDHDLWVASYRDEEPRGLAQLWRIHGIEERVEWVTALPGQVQQLWQGRDALWIATEEPDALWRRDLATGALVMMAQFEDDDGDPDSRPDWVPPCVRVADSRPDGGVHARLWMESLDGAQWSEVRVDSGKQGFHWRRHAGGTWEFAGATATPVAEVSGRGMKGWFATSRGLLEYDGSAWTHVPIGAGIEDSSITAVIPNHEGGVWVGTRTQGVALVQAPLIRVPGAPDGLAGKNTHSVTASPDGRLLVGVHGSGIAILDPGTMKAAPLPSFRPGLGLCALFQDGRLISAAPNLEGGPEVTRERASWHLHLIRSNGSSPNLAEVSQVHVARDGTPWLVRERELVQIRRLPDGQPSGLIFCNEGPDFRVWTLHPDPRVHLIGIAEDASGRLWVGTGNHGLFRIEGEQVAWFPDTHSPPESMCVPLGFSPDGTLWLGSENGLGIWRDGAFRWIRPADGLSESVVCDMEEAEGHVWFAGKRGVHAVRRQELEDFFAGRIPRVNPLSLARSDGFPPGEARLNFQPAMARCADGSIWVATSGGLAGFDPREVLETLRPPPVAIAAILSNERPFPAVAERMVLPPGGGRGVEVLFDSVSFTTPERVTYSYEIIGPNTQIHRETSQPHAVLTHLRPGTYRVAVRARGGSGLVSNPPARLEFEILPRYFETVWFRGLSMASVAGAVVGLVSLRLRSARRASRIEQELRLTDQRRKIAQDMHDELGAELTRMTLRLGGNGGVSSGVSPGALGPGADPRSVLRALDETVWVVNPSKDSLESVVGYLEAWMEDFFTGSPMTAVFDLPSEIPKILVPGDWRHHLLRWVKESCCNVLRHSRATHVHFTFRIDAGGRAVEVVIQDNGCGFRMPAIPPEVGAGAVAAAEPANGRGGNGLGSLRDRARQLGGRMDITSAPGQGTCVRMVAPLP
ncbi:MAG: hypothetical protein KF791_12755 [Verrucomicrobiae bacterium]|nr:hypothetical protein [Verrucomicrobiae bacterium]